MKLKLHFGAIDSKCIINIEKKKLKMLWLRIKYSKVLLINFELHSIKSVHQKKDKTMNFKSNALKSIIILIKKSKYKTEITKFKIILL